MNGNNPIGGGTVEPQSRAKLESDRNGRLQRRRPFRHPVAERQRAGRDLGNERDQPDRRRAVGPNPGPSWKAIGTGDFNDDGHSDILWQNTNGQAAIWEMNGTNADRRRDRRRQSRAELESDRNGRLQRRRPFRHPVAEHERPGRDLGNERDQRDRRRDSGANPGPSWKAIGTGDFNDDGHSDILWQNTQRPSRDLGNERDDSDRRRDCERQSRAELESDRNGRLQRRRPFRHPISKHERPNRDLGNEREQHNRRRGREPQSRAELARCKA